MDFLPQSLEHILKKLYRHGITAFSKPVGGSLAKLFRKGAPGDFDQLSGGAGVIGFSEDLQDIISYVFRAFCVLQFDDPVDALAERGHRLLECLSQVPGHDDLGELQPDRLAAWVKAVRDTCRELGRLELADICIGKLLSRAPTGKDSAWALHVLRQDARLDVCGLLTTVNDEHHRVAMHGVRESLLRAQAASVGLPVCTVPLPHPCSNDVYENCVAEALKGAASCRE